MTEITKKYILSRKLDLWITGLASIVLISTLLIVNPASGNIATFGDVLTVTTVINGAHFMASYRMLYYSRSHAMRYPQASIWMPLALVSYCLVAACFAETIPAMVSSVFLVSSLYLALHYTGQTWGMMSSLAFLDGIRFSENQRRLFRRSLHCLLAWQVLWSLHILDPKPAWLGNLLGILSILPSLLMIGAAMSGIMGVVSLYRDLKTFRLRMMVPYISLYFWYALLAVNYLALPLVQFFHAMQYLIFPLRVEMNRSNLTPESSSRHLVEYLFAIILTGGIVFVFVPSYFSQLDPALGGIVKLLISAVNIHHFYIDGYIWKISQPVVRDELFAHLRK